MNALFSTFYFYKGFQFSLYRLRCQNPKKVLLAIKSSYYFSPFLSLMAISPQNLSKSDEQNKIKYFFTSAKLRSSTFKMLTHQFCLLYWTFMCLNSSFQTQVIFIHFGTSLPAVLLLSMLPFIRVVSDFGYLS